MNYLQLCQDMVRESGTISGDATPPSTSGQSGRLLKVVNWVSKAWQQIQNLHDDWLWMRQEFTGAVTTGAAMYTAASWNVSRWSRWITDEDTVTIYANVIGVADERMIRFVDWAYYRKHFGRGLQVPNRPTCYTISPQGEFCFGPIPDQNYTVNGEYQQTAQVLANDTDVPELPDPVLHSVIVWKGVLLISQFDEGNWPTAAAQIHVTDDLRSMMRYRPVPEIKFCGGSSIA